MQFTSMKREEIMEKMQSTELDLLVVGGGITGAGIALDAITRGMNAAIIEMQDFAAGTSSRSTKLIHGGLRYLKQFEVKMVAEVGKEREIVYENGPHVTTPEWMMLPLYKGGTFGPLSTSLGLKVYDFLAGVKQAERRRMFSAEEALKREPLLKEEAIRGAGYYVEYKTDDARLTMEVMKKAVEKGALAINYAKADQFVYENGRVKGVEVADQISGKRYTVNAKRIVNATGPWVDTLREKDNSKKGKTLQLTKGTHIVFDAKQFPLKQAIYFDTPDGRMVFAIPRDGKTYIGTTDTVYQGDISKPAMTAEDCDYLINAINFMFPEVNISARDVESSWAGLRPLIHEEGKDPSELSRKDEIFVSTSGLISIAGGKLTGYRKMGESVVDVVAKQLTEETGRKWSPSSTKYLRISGGEVGGSEGFKVFAAIKGTELAKAGLAKEVADQLIQRYGSNIDKVMELYLQESSQRNEADLDPLVAAMVRYSIEYELCFTLADFFVRRTGALYFDIDWVKKHQKKVEKYMEKRLGWTKDQTALYSTELRELMYEATHSEHLLRSS